MDGLVEKLNNFNGALTGAEQANFKLLLGLAAGGLAPQFERPVTGPDALAFDAVSNTLARLQPYSARIGRDGIAYRGRPAIMSDGLLASLQAEARTARSKAQRFEEHFLGCGGPIANELSVSSAFGFFVSSHAGSVKTTGIASYLFYDEEGQGIEPHIDTDIFSLNVILMLDHSTSNTGKPSALVVFPPGLDPIRLDLEPGEIVIMFAGSITHGREHVRQGESVTILTFGFHPLGI